MTAKQQAAKRTSITAAAAAAAATVNAAAASRRPRAGSSGVAGAHHEPQDPDYEAKVPRSFLNYSLSPTAPIDGNRRGGLKRRTQARVRSVWERGVALDNRE